MRRIALALGFILAPSLAWAEGTVLDLNSAPFSDMVPVTSGTPFTAGRSIRWVCTTNAVLTVTMASAGRTVALPVIGSVQFQTDPLSVTQIVVTSGTCPSLWNMP